jgi:hypothetical protein
MNLRKALRVFDAASPEERKTLRPILAGKRKEDMTPAERVVLMPKLDRALKP